MSIVHVRHLGVVCKSNQQTVSYIWYSFQTMTQTLMSTFTRDVVEYDQSPAH